MLRSQCVRTYREDGRREWLAPGRARLQRYADGKDGIVRCGYRRFREVSWTLCIVGLWHKRRRAVVYGGCGDGELGVVVRAAASRCRAAVRDVERAVGQRR